MQNYQTKMQAFFVILLNIKIEYLLSTQFEFLLSTHFGYLFNLNMNNAIQRRSEMTFTCGSDWFWCYVDKIGTGAMWIRLVQVLCGSAVYCYYEVQNSTIHVDQIGSGTFWLR